MLSSTHTDTNKTRVFDIVGNSYACPFSQIKQIMRPILYVANRFQCTSDLQFTKITTTTTKKEIKGIQI